MIGDVFADVANGSVGTNNDFLIIFGNLFRTTFGFLCLPGRGRCSSAPHHPAAVVLAFRLKSKHARFFEFGERRIPEVQVQNLALARQKVILDIEPVHGFKMAMQHGSRNQFGDSSGFACGIFDGVKGVTPCLQICFVLFIPLRDAGIEFPAVIVKARQLSKSFDFGTRFLVDMREAYDHVRHLHTGIVDVILHIDCPACIT